MASHHSSPAIAIAIATAEPERQISDFSGENGIHGDGGDAYLEVYVHQARDIQNICIYHKQDVYAKLYLTTHPQTTVSTKIINGGGQNPIFDDFLRLNVPTLTLDSSLRCEVWMLSRVKNYLEDQLLGFALVPLSDILVGSQGKQPHPHPHPQEFSLSSSDLFHSPSGYVKLSISYSGPHPDVYAIPNPRAAANTVMQESDALAADYDKIEFPDPNVLTQNHMMVSQYFGLDSQSPESLLPADADDSSAGVHVVESFSEASLSTTDVDVANKDTPASSFSTNESPTASLPASSNSFSDSPGASKSSNHELLSPLREKHADADLPKGKDETDFSNGKPSNKSGQSVFGVNIVPEKTVVQQEIVDMYLKSMQQFTESLAKMKLPMDIENVSIESGSSNGSTEPTLQTPKSTGSRVFYGSRAFF